MAAAQGHCFLNFTAESPVFCSAPLKYLVKALFWVAFWVATSLAAETVTGKAPQRQPNENGKIMVLMYHRIGTTESPWRRSRANFRRDLETLYVEGYRPISLFDLVSNDIRLPAGYSPVVLTFDDGGEDQFRILVREGKPQVDPESAVGILEDFHRQHPDFPLEATFFLHGQRPFGQEEWVKYKLNYLISKGMDIGNHTSGHQDLREERHADPLKIQQYIGAQRDYLESVLSEHPDYKIESLALCHGHRPRNRSLARFVVRGQYRGRKYQNWAVLNVGSGPVPSPSSRDFNPHSIPRIRASNMGIGRLGIGGWLEYFRQNSEQRYVSDGQPDMARSSESIGD